MYTITITTTGFTKDYVLNYWKDDKIIGSELVNAEDLPAFLAEKTDIDKIILAGNKLFNFGLKEIILQQTDNNIKIEVI